MGSLYCDSMVRINLCSTRTTPASAWSVFVRVDAVCCHATSFLVTVKSRRCQWIESYSGLPLIDVSTESRIDLWLDCSWQLDWTGVCIHWPDTLNTPPGCSAHLHVLLLLYSRSRRIGTGVKRVAERGCTLMPWHSGHRCQSFPACAMHGIMHSDSHMQTDGPRPAAFFFLTCPYLRWYHRYQWDLMPNTCLVRMKQWVSVELSRWLAMRLLLDRTAGRF
jgi:hypothetical protein